MLFPKLTMPELPEALRWRTIPMSKGLTVEGWLAGPVVDVLTHFSKFECSKPCRRLISGGVLPCRCDNGGASLRRIGYCPIIDRQREKFVVILSATVIPKVERIKPGTPIRFTRPTTGIRPVSVSVLDPGTLGSAETARVAATCVHDISEYCLHLWQDKELCAHFGAKHYPAGKHFTTQQDEAK